jgi:hypothetical protein
VVSRFQTGSLKSARSASSESRLREDVGPAAASAVCSVAVNSATAAGRCCAGGGGKEIAAGPAPAGRLAVCRS